MAWSGSKLFAKVILRQSWFLLFTTDMSDLEKVTNLIPAEVRQNPTGGESSNVLVNSEPVKKPPSPAMDIPDVEPGPSEPSEICVENDNNSSEGSEDSGTDNSR